MLRLFAASCALSASLLAGCSTLGGPDDISLVGRGTHTGTLHLLRVDDTWAPDVRTETGDWRPANPSERCNRVIGTDHLGTMPEDGAPVAGCDPDRRFVPLRHKDNVEGLDTLQDIVLPTEDVTVTFNYGFLRFFNEGTGGNDSPLGEIAMVLSFDSGDDSRESFLFYASQGQTFGSFFNFQDWPAIGPVNVTAANLSMRIVLIELDAEENAEATQLVRNIAQAASVLAPGLGGIIALATPSAETIIAQNEDDVIFDQRFSLRRGQAGDPIDRAPLLYGKYVAVLQEDRLAATNAAENAPDSVQPVLVPELRYDLRSDRLYQAFSYFPYTADEMFDDRGPVYLNRRPSAPQTDMAACPTELIDEVNSLDAQALRQRTLGFSRDAALDEIDLWCNLDRVLTEIDRLTVRYSDNSPDGGSRTRPEYLDYNLILYPQALTALTQYPTHTHLVFTIEESVGHSGRAYHERFPDFQLFLEQQIEAARSNDDIETLVTAFQEAVTAENRREAAMISLRAQTDASPQDRVCTLVNGLFRAATNTAVSNAFIFDKMYKQTGRVFTRIEDVAAYLGTEAYTLENMSVPDGSDAADLGAPACSPVN